MASPPLFSKNNIASIPSRFTYTIITIFTALSFFSQKKLVIADDSTSTCEYPCQPPPITLTNCPPPPSPPSPESETPVYSYPPPPPSPSGVSGYWNPPPPPSSGYNPYFSPPNSYHNYNSPPPPNPILPWFPWYYYYNKAPVSEGNSIFSKGLSGGIVVLIVAFVGLIMF